jgi:cyclic beta-1,2-glucan synthetase
VPGSWDGFIVRWRHGKSRYEITVENPGRRNRGIAHAMLDGARVDPQAVPLIDDAGVHRLLVVMGESEPEPSPVLRAETTLSSGNPPGS